MLYLHSIGCRRIGLINGPLIVDPFKERYLGYSKAVADLKLEEIVYTAEQSSFDYYNLGYSGLLNLVEQYGAIDGVVVATELEGMGVLSALKLLKKRVPEDVCVITLTGNSIGKLLETPLTSMDIPINQMGIKAVDILDDLLRSEEHKYIQHIVFNHTLVLRKTTR